MNYLVGLTGGIGSGKSTVADMFAALGVRIIDTDLISHQLTQAGGAAIPALRDAFGAQVIDAHGALDRGKMRELVFGSPAEEENDWKPSCIRSYSPTPSNKPLPPPMRPTHWLWFHCCSKADAMPTGCSA